jgi:hypothetical protein
MEHPVQESLLMDQKRFKVCCAGRRSGKSENAKRFLVEEAIEHPGRYFAAAPTRPNAKDLWWDDLKLLSYPVQAPGGVSETELTIRIRNGSLIKVLGLDKPARIEGPPWRGGVVDEIADCKPGAWPEHIRPALDTLGLDAWCWLIGVPNGLNHYYDIAQQAKSDPEWGFYHWVSADILPKDVIRQAMGSLSPRQFRQEYEASFETASGRVYEDYSADNHTDRVFDPKLGHVIWAHDFNYTPLSSAIMQVPKQGGPIYAVDEIVLESAVASNAAAEFIERYQRYSKKLRVLIYGDASGKQGEKHGKVSDYVRLEVDLKKAGFRVERRVPSKNPAIKDSQNSLRAKIKTAEGKVMFFVNPSKCPMLNKGLLTTQLKKGSTFQEADSDGQHITSACRYFTAKAYPVNRTGGGLFFSPMG